MSITETGKSRPGERIIQACLLLCDNALQRLARLCPQGNQVVVLLEALAPILPPAVMKTRRAPGRELLQNFPALILYAVHSAHEVDDVRAAGLVSHRSLHTP